MPAVASVRPCPACTFLNLPSAAHCDVCDEPLGAPPRSDRSAIITPVKSMDGVKVKTEGVTVKPEPADGGATPAIVKAEVKDEDEEEPALVCVPRTAPKKKQAPAPAPAPAAPAPAPQADDDDEEPEICRPRTAPVVNEDEKVAMKKQSGYQHHNATHRATVKKEIEAENPDLPAKEKNSLITKRLGTCGRD